MVAKSHAVVDAVPLHLKAGRDSVHTGDEVENLDQSCMDVPTAIHCSSKQFSYSQRLSLFRFWFELNRVNVISR